MTTATSLDWTMRIFSVCTTRERDFVHCEHHNTITMNKIWIADWIAYMSFSVVSDSSCPVQHKSILCCCLPFLSIIRLYRTHSHSPRRASLSTCLFIAQFALVLTYYVSVSLLVAPLSHYVWCGCESVCCAHLIVLVCYVCNSTWFVR